MSSVLIEEIERLEAKLKEVEAERDRYDSYAQDETRRADRYRKMLIETREWVDGWGQERLKAMGMWEGDEDEPSSLAAENLAERRLRDQALDVPQIEGVPQNAERLRGDGQND